MPKLNNILIIRLSSLGDVLMSIPAVRAIRDKFPAAHISWLVEGSVGEFLACQDFIDEVIRFPRGDAIKGLKKGNISRTQKALGSFLRHLRGREYDLVVDFHGIAKSAFFAMIARGKKKIGFGNMFAKEKSHFFYHKRVNGSDKRIHKVERNMLLANYLGYNNSAPEVALNVPDNAASYVDTFLREIGTPPSLFAVNPFSSKGTDFKRWPMERYAELIARIKHELQGHTVILWGPGEQEEARRLQEMSPDSAYLACPTNVSQLFALLKKIDIYIGGDTGVMHLAAAAPTPVVAIFGPTDVKINAPYGSGHAVIREDMPCSPCKKKNCRQRQCLTHITVDEVFEAVSVLYKRSATN
jgi:3-deoxy-D-manno-octulosonic-acid transferase/heptosyltransferase-1